MFVTAGKRVAVLIPCYNEEGAITDVVRSFQTELPDAEIYVYDNNSTDNTIAVATQAGAHVSRESRQGKGNVVRRMFADIEANYYILVDGDGTYDAKHVSSMLNALDEQNLDMVTGVRVEAAGSAAAYRRGHRFGNRVLNKLVSTVFGTGVGDLLSGYRVFSRRFVRSFPAQSRGFEIETELTVHALELRMPIADVEVAYSDRAVGTESKLRTYIDGLKILRTIVILAKEVKPFQVFSLAALALVIIALILGVPVITEFLNTGLVPRLPTAVLTSALVLAALLAFFCGLILDSLARTRRELKRMWYINADSKRS